MNTMRADNERAIMLASPFQQVDTLAHCQLPQHSSLALLLYLDFDALGDSDLEADRTITERTPKPTNH